MRRSSSRLCHTSAATLEVLSTPKNDLFPPETGQAGPTEHWHQGGLDSGIMAGCGFTQLPATSLAVSSVYTGYLALSVSPPCKGRADTHQRDMSKGKWMGSWQHSVVLPHAQKHVAGEITITHREATMETMAPKAQTQSLLYRAHLYSSKGTGGPGGFLPHPSSLGSPPCDLPSGEVPTGTPVLVDPAPP